MCTSLSQEYPSKLAPFCHFFLVASGRIQTTSLCHYELSVLPLCSWGTNIIGNLLHSGLYLVTFGIFSLAANGRIQTTSLCHYELSVLPLCYQGTTVIGYFLQSGFQIPFKNSSFCHILLGRIQTLTSSIMSLVFYH